MSSLHNRFIFVRIGEYEGNIRGLNPYYFTGIFEKRPPIQINYAVIADGKGRR